MCVDAGAISPLYAPFLFRAQMAELVDALRSGRSVLMDVEVRVLFWAPIAFSNLSHDALPIAQNRALQIAETALHFAKGILQDAILAESPPIKYLIVLNKK